MSKYHDILHRIYKLENIIACNKAHMFESLVCYKSAGEFIKLMVKMKLFLYCKIR